MHRLTCLENGVCPHVRLPRDLSTDCKLKGEHGPEVLWQALLTIHISIRVIQVPYTDGNLSYGSWINEAGKNELGIMHGSSLGHLKCSLFFGAPYSLYLRAKWKGNDYSSSRPSWLSRCLRR